LRLSSSKSRLDPAYESAVLTRRSESMDLLAEAWADASIAKRIRKHRSEPPLTCARRALSAAALAAYSGGREAVDASAAKNKIVASIAEAQMFRLDTATGGTPAPTTSGADCLKVTTSGITVGCW